MRSNALAQAFTNYVLNPYGILLILFALGWFLMFVSGRPLIEWLRHRKGMKWAPREDTPDSHLQKAGTPSMGGIGIIGAAIVGWLAFLFFSMGASELFRPGQFRPGLDLMLVAIFPILVALHALLGYLDDHFKATNKGGLSSKAKLLGQIILAAVFLGSVVTVDRWSSLPFHNGSQLPFGLAPDSSWLSSWILLAFALLLIIGTSNAVNLTDGIDGLAAGLSVQVAALFSLLYLESPTIVNRVIGPLSVELFWMALGGACLGFLAFNKHPAKVFMGDTGSLALGAALGAGAILTRTVWLLPFVGFIFYIEMFSVILQVLYFKYTRRKFGEGKRLFRRAPLHHHFELSGWSEWRVVGTFWLVNLATTIVGLVLWKLGVLPRFP